KTDSPDADSSAKHTEGEESHQPIATFDEWTKEKLKQELRKAVPPAAALDTGLPSTQTQPIAPPTATTRNYASRECGAKVLLSNAEAENTKAILNEKEKDEYMRNPCEKADNKFVIVELCETIQPRSIEIANYELFSSGPRDIRLWSAERFPNGEWRLLSDLTAADSRQIQQFPVPFTGAYAKFIKLLSHYGSEHYCTLSVLKVLGISMVDEYEAEVTFCHKFIFVHVIAIKAESYEVGCLCTDWWNVPCSVSTLTIQNYFLENVPYQVHSALAFFVPRIGRTYILVSSVKPLNNTRPPAFLARSGMSSLSRLRRSRFAFLQRKSTKAEKPQDTSSTKVLSQNNFESVFMKLNKRIAALELNMSLSSEYLSELSRQYVAQTDEHQKHLKQAKKVVEEAVEAIYARVNETLAYKVSLHIVQSAFHKTSFIAIHRLTTDCGRYNLLILLVLYKVIVLYLDGTSRIHGGHNPACNRLFACHPQLLLSTFYHRATTF
ncbi:unnamed protein product, partial [Cylicostephanus goldi]